MLYKFSLVRSRDKRSQSHGDSGMVNLPHNLRIKSIRAVRSKRHPYEEFDDSQLESVSVIETCELRSLEQGNEAKGVGASSKV